MSCPTVTPFGELDAHLTIPDLWQQEALHHLRNGFDVVVNAPTGAGKTYLVELIAESRRAGQIVLAVPTRALANDKLREFRSKGWRVGIVTGDVTIDPEAPIVVATLETQKTRFIDGIGPSLFVIDEYQMIGDAARGVNYELCIARVPSDTQMLLLSGSVSNPQEIVAWLERLGRKATLVTLEKRPVPLEEIHLDSIDRRPPKTVTGFWPRLLAKALMADLGPVLVFSPQRKTAERLARQLAAALPVENPLALSAEQKRLAGRSIESLLAKRIAYHHSGLSYQQRAGLIEPLAKAGQLRIVVSTTGLAAGVNFSMKSVLVTESQFTVGHVQHLIKPDELLQMFGRAGRRGLDTVGYALSAPDRPRLREGRQSPIRRPKLLDWPSLIGVMEIARQKKEDPFEKAAEACSRLFNETQIDLGIERSLSFREAPCDLRIDAARAKYSQPESVEILNSKGGWEPRQPKRRARLEEVRIRSGDSVVPVLEDVEWVKRFSNGRIGRIKGSSGSRRFERKVVLGFQSGKSREKVQLAGWLWKQASELGVLADRRIGLETLNTIDFCGALALGDLIATRWERHRLIGLFDLSRLEQEVDIDVFGVALVDPEERKAYPLECQTCPQHPVCESELSPAGSPALSWLKLKLIDARGIPTRRGVVFSLFQGGEGLAVAAALEEESYSVDAIAHDIANLRAGYRFDEYSQYSHRLSRACRVAYTDRSYDGYLKHGLPLQYGEGAAEVIAEWIQSPGKGRNVLGDDLRFGDVQRAKLEWLSLLRYIVNAPDIGWDRWSELQEAARALLSQDDQRLLIDDLPPLEPSQTSRINHQLRFPRGY